MIKRSRHEELLDLSDSIGSLSRRLTRPDGDAGSHEDEEKLLEGYKVRLEEYLSSNPDPHQVKQ